MHTHIYMHGYYRYIIDFNMIDNLSIAHIFARHMLTSLSVDEILLPRYINLLFNFRDLPHKLEIVHSYLKHMNFVLFVFI